mgnify:CR=1 FL=1
MHLGVVLRDCVGNLLQDDRLARLGGRDDEATLALADGSDEVDHALRELLVAGLEPQALLRVERRQVAELDAVGVLLQRAAVDRIDPDDCVVLLTPGALAIARLTDRADDRVALAEVVLLDLAERDVDVVRTGQVAARTHEGVVLKDVEDAGDRQQDVVLGDLGLEIIATTATLAVALTRAA